MNRMFIVIYIRPEPYRKSGFISYKEHFFFERKTPTISLENEKFCLFALNYYY